MCSAQHALRLVAYDQIHVVLGCSPQVGNEARKRQAEDDEEIKVDEDDGENAIAYIYKQFASTFRVKKAKAKLIKFALRFTKRLSR